MRRSARKIGFAGVLAGSTVLATAAGAQDPAQRPRFEATASRVVVDVIVSAANGFVEGLTADDFRVFEDGRPVRVLDVELVDLTLGTSTSAELDAVTEPERAARPAGGEAEAPAAVVGEQGTIAPHTPGAMVFLIDTPSLSPDTKQRFADAWMRILDSTETLGVPRAAYYIDYAGRIVELAALGTDIDTMLLAAAEVEALPITSERRVDGLIELAAGLPAPGRSAPEFVDAFGQPVDLDLATRPAVAKMRILEDEERRRGQIALDSLLAFCDALWAIEGRTSLVWVSSGVRLMQAGPAVALLAAFEDAGQRAMNAPVSELVPGMRSMRADLTSPDLRVMQQQERLFEAANSANVSIYGIDPTLLISARMPGVDASVGSGGFREGVSDPLVIGALDALGDSLRMAAEATGGRAFVHATDLEAALREVEADASRYYLVTYAPPRARADGNYHEIRVQVDAPGTSVRWRRGYAHLSEAARRQRTALATQAVPGLVTGASRLALAHQAGEQARQQAAAMQAARSETPTSARVEPDPESPGGTESPGDTESRGGTESRGDTEVSLESDPLRLAQALDRLAGTARFYRDSALAFACDETVVATAFNAVGGIRRRSAWELRYIYAVEEPPEGAPPDTFQRLRDYRTRRDSGTAPGEAAEEVRLEDLNLPAATMRAYSWAFLFQEGLQPHYRFDLVAEGRALDREALVISFEPVPPVVTGFNDWFGRAWVDAETYQVLRVDALQAADYAELDAIEKDRLTLNIPRDGRLVVRLEAEFDVEERGVRLPSKVALSGEDYSLQALAFGMMGGISSTLPEWRVRGRVDFRVEQRYDNCRFSNVEVR